MAPHLCPRSDVDGFDREFATKTDSEAEDFGFGFGVDDFSRCCREGSGSSVANVTDRDRLASGLAKIVTDESLVGDRLFIEVSDKIAGLQTGCLGGTARLDAADADFGG